MLGTRRLCIDRQSEVYDMLAPWADDTFYDFGPVPHAANTIYVIGRQQIMDHMARIRDMCHDPSVTMIFNNSAEGSWTIDSQIKQFKIEQLIRDGLLLLIAGADTSIGLPCLTHEHLLTKIMDFDETLACQRYTDEIFNRRQKPYQFLFLNGRARAHRKYMYERMSRLGLLDRALWTMLEAKPCVVRHFDLTENDINIMATPTPLRRLPDHYEVPRYREPVFGPILPDRTFLKQELFRQEWGEIYLYPEPYIDTYFSLVTETVCAESDISFRTEKIAKPLAMGHPFIVVSTPGYYRDLRNLGFRTFDHVIDESFDQIDNPQARVDRVIEIVTDLCQQDLDSFLDQCRERCKYNQQHLAEFTIEHRRSFPVRFSQFLDKHARS